jgi:hypothetical protein
MVDAVLMGYLISLLDWWGYTECWGVFDGIASEGGIF